MIKNSMEINSLQYCLYQIVVFFTSPTNQNRRKSNSAARAGSNTNLVLGTRRAGRVRGRNFFFYLYHTYLLYFIYYIYVNYIIYISKILYICINIQIKNIYQK